MEEVERFRRWAASPDRGQEAKVLEALRDGALISFPVRKVDGASVIWINERYFSSRGLEIQNLTVRELVLDWLIGSFAYCVPDPKHGLDNSSADELIVHADRYGSSGASIHGGSGRAAIRGAFQVKGVGRTPLVDGVKDWSYSHGCMWLEEAIREAVFSEIASLEFPVGAVPVVAIIDLGCEYIHDDGSIGERRALVVRPIALRPAHLERAVAFCSREKGRRAIGEHGKDVERAKNMVRHVSAGCECELGSPPSCCVERLVQRIGTQVAFGQIWRMFHGGYFSSNLTMDGELIDFGSFRAVRGWGVSFSSAQEPPFGKELILVNLMVDSLVFCVNKFSQRGGDKLDSFGLREVVSRTIESSWASLAERLGWGAEGRATGDALRGLYFRLQRLRPGDQVDGFGWVRGLFNALESGDCGERAIARRQMESALGLEATDELVRSLRLRASVSRLLMPREILFREVLQSLIYRFIGGERSIDLCSTSDFIDGCMTRGRRWWPSLPQGMVVVAYAACRSTCVLICWDEARGQNVCVLEGDFRADGIWVMGKKVSTRDYEVGASPRRAVVVVQLVFADGDEGIRAQVGCELIDLPKFWQIFPVQKDMISSKLRRCLAEAGEYV